MVGGALPELRQPKAGRGLRWAKKGILIMEIELKSYSNASNARRAAKAANLIVFTLVKQGPGFVIVEAPAPAPALASTAPTGAPTKADKRSAAMADHDAFKAKQRAPRKAKAP